MSRIVTAAGQAVTLSQASELDDVLSLVFGHKCSCSRAGSSNAVSADAAIAPVVGRVQSATQPARNLVPPSECLLC